MTATLIICGITFFGIILSLLKNLKITVKRVSVPLYLVFAVTGAIFALVFSGIPLSTVLNGLTNKNAVNPLKLLVIFFSLTFLSVFLDEIGFFSYIAVKAVVLAKSSQKKLFTYLYIITSVLTVFTSNDIIILTLTPFIIYFSKNAKINPIPYLISEFVSANTFSLLLLIGNPTNIYLATNYGLDFIGYFTYMFIPAIISGIFAYVVLRIIFIKQLSQEINISYKNNKITDRFLYIIGLTHLTLCIVLIALSGYIDIEMWFICLLFATSLFLFYIMHTIINKNGLGLLKNLIKRLPFELIPFIISMFIIVLAIVNCGLAEKIASILDNDLPILTYGYVSFFTSNLLNNIPMSVLFSELIKTGSVNSLQRLLATVIGSNIGAYLTPLGALAGIMWVRILKQHEINFSFSKFIGYGIIIALPVMTVALFGLYLAVILF